jgi:hypothetical protein
MKVHRASRRGTHCRFEWGRQKHLSSKNWEEVTCRSCLKLYRLACERNRSMYQRWVDHGKLPPIVTDNLERARQRGRPTTLKECAEHVALWTEKRDWVEARLAQETS